MSRRDIITLTLLVLLSVFLFADQRIMYAILKELMAEYGLSKVAVGTIGSAFILVGAVISVLFGYWSDQISRKKLLVYTVLIGELPCLLTGFTAFTQTLEGFVTLRILTGIGIGGIYPISFSLISDYFKEKHRPMAAAMLGVAWVIGMGLGLGLAGYLTNSDLRIVISEEWGLVSYGWRLAFVLSAAPAFPLVLLFLLYARDPERGRTDEGISDVIAQGIEYKNTIRLDDIKLLFQNKTNLWTFFQGIPGTIPWGVLGFWLVDFFETQRGFSKEDATTINLILTLGALIGSVLFAYLGEKLYARNPKYMVYMCGGGILAGTVPAFILLNTVSLDLTSLIVLSFFAGTLVAVSTANVKSILMNVNRPEHRGSVFAVFNISDNLGQGFGPLIGAVLIGPLTYLGAMNFAAFWWIPCGLAFLVIARYINQDRAALHRLLNQRAEEMQAQHATQGRSP